MFKDFSKKETFVLENPTSDTKYLFLRLKS